MRTTINLEDEVLRLARDHARRRQITLGEAVSELVRRGAQQPLATVEVNGLKVARVAADSPVVTSKRVRELLDEFP